MRLAPVAEKLRRYRVALLVSSGVAASLAVAMVAVERRPVGPLTTTTVRTKLSLFLLPNKEQWITVTPMILFPTRVAQDSNFEIRLELHPR